MASGGNGNGNGGGNGFGYGGSKKRDVDVEADLHGLTAEQMRVTLQEKWPQWQGKQSVRIIHGQGTVLRPEVERWCREMGIPVSLDPINPGALKIYPRERFTAGTGVTNSIGVSLREKGLRLTPEQEAELRDPVAMERARQEERRRREAEARKKQEDEAARRQRLRQEESLWQAEMARLDRMDKQRGSASAASDAKPVPPRIIPAPSIKHQEGLWRGELVRVADTDTETLTKQKRTGLDKLAPPMPAVDKDKPQSGTASTPPPRALTPLEKARARRPQRDTAADQALFEAELARLMEE